MTFWNWTLKIDSLFFKSILEYDIIKLSSPESFFFSISEIDYTLTRFREGFLGIRFGVGSKITPPRLKLVRIML